MGLIRESITQLEDSPIIDVWRLGFGLPDVIGLWAGEPDVPTPAFICEAASRALMEGHTFYSPNRGIPELREALAGYHRRLYGLDIPERRLTLTQSGMQAVMLVAQAMVEPGDNAVAITPSWPNVMRAMQINGAAIREVPLGRGNDGWHLDLDRVFASCDARTRVIYTASPANPTGWMMSRAEGEALLDFARRRNIALLSDEVYHRIVYAGEAAFSLLEIAAPEDPVFVVNSFSKSWAMTGWRMGWMVYPDGLAPEFEKLIQFNTSGGQAFLQHGAIAALEQGEDFVRSFVARCRTGHEVVAGRLARMRRIRDIPNQGSFYAMFEIDGVSDTLGFCRRAVTEARIGLAPGIAFGAGADRMVRLCFAKSPELLHRAMDRLESFVENYKE
ncbi:Aminotransferase [Rhodovastum atsumiense]|uniref:Aminotransferase n=1 Tax=Rhodovastum atsumiense TaxID=504468 RepID=A0A5M6J0N5_9PROT|nr:pyridoxal phosphate-dependent aminotransferase [Rhodovastum atsumiense]KAA5614150.1 aminotransferase class I/II-fold pyridoxal phosphate-dependent enzyme [Rhodovastum atsumiense]CAH2599004.1 Aminotransferase [Rhodovastum atsumiense]